MSRNRKSEVEQAQKTLDFTKNNYQVIFETSMGTITLDTYPDIAPGHVKNILGLAAVGFYDGIIFHRVIPGFVIQAGCPEGSGSGGPGYTIRAEFNPTPHEAGILSMARTNDPHSAGSQFFLCLGKVASLDRQYTVFGKTADQSSLDIVLKIGATKTDRNDRPINDVTINKGSIKAIPK